MSQATFSHEDRKDGIRNTVLLLLLLMAVLVGMFVYRILQPQVMSAKEMVRNGAIMFEIPREVSAFNLLDTSGDAFTLDTLRGSWTFVFFGFTHCPDICPTTVAMFNEVAAELEGTPWAADTRYLLVSLDPARDTPEVLDRYLAHFNPDFLGATGEFLQLQKFASQLNVAFRKVVTDFDSGAYTIDHGGSVALLNPQARFHGFYKPPLDPARIAMTYQSVRMQAE